LNILTKYESFVLTEFYPTGVHVVHAIIDGMIDTDRVRGMVGERADFVSPEA